MKICPKCGKTFSDEYGFCSTCGCNLVERNAEPKKLNTNAIVAIVVIAIIAFSGIVLGISEHNKVKDTQEQITAYKRDKQLEEYRNTPTTADIEIDRGWTIEDTRAFTYINGTVRNVSSSKTIRYYEIEAKYYDKNGNMIDSDWTNGSDLGPNEAQEFQIMHKKDENIATTHLSIKEVE